MSGFIAVMIEPRGVPLEGERAIVLNQEDFPTREAAQARADRQAAFERNFCVGDKSRFAVLELPDPAP
ncbi:hypothetical protein [Arthrobacter sp. B2a2-09]|uniref:hypothetical protein n=1 Tax=Arthrobacter sp. B2a2-09 TaxID=2952822 RepID=UPI0022CD4D76|nr:hypothetical protein [Arthrobacter sp. B2a2-09]MCZ9884624.1 hypothetical protein [Arthrobacter sp. B2a2-09]